MARIKLLLTNTAVKQRSHVFEYWNERNKSKKYSNKLNLRIKERLQSLKKNPRIGKKVDFENTRVISLGYYSIFYKQIDSNLFVTAFWDNRRDPKKLLKELK